MLNPSCCTATMDKRGYHGLLGETSSAVANGAAAVTVTSYPRNDMYALCDGGHPKRCVCPVWMNARSAQEML